MDNEFHYVLSSDINQNVRTYIGSLEIPASQTIVPQESSTVQYLRASNIRLYVTVSLQQDSTVHSSTQVITQRSKLSKTGREARSEQHDRQKIGLHAPQSTVHEWGEWLILPIQYCAVPRSAVLKLKIWALDGKMIGETLLHVFHESSVMRTGVQKLLVYSNDTTGTTSSTSDKKEYTTAATAATAANTTSTNDPSTMDGYVSDELHDVRFRQQRFREQYENGEMVRVEWLDRAVDAYEQALSYETQYNNHPDRPKVGLPSNHVCHTHGSIFLYVELPRPRHPILYNEKMYDTYHTGMNAGGGSGNKSNASSNRTRRNRPNNRNEGGPRAVGRRGGGRNNNGVGSGNGQSAQSLSMERWYHRLEQLESSASADAARNNHHGLDWSRSLNPIVDHSFNSSHISMGGSSNNQFSHHQTISPVEHMRETLLKSGLKDEHLLKPSKEMKTEIARIISLFSDEINQQERSILWKYRHSLIDNSNASVKFILIVDWDKEEEHKIGVDLLAKWTSIGVDSAMKLLNKRFANDYPSEVRQFAVKALETLPDDELGLYMLQLVQALRYDILPTNQQQEEDSEDGVLISVGNDRYPLVQFLLHRCCNNLSLANDFYWSLEVEKEDVLMSNHFINISKLYLAQLNATPFGRNVISVIKNQVNLVDQLKKCHFNSVFRKEIKSLKPPQKSILLKESLGERKPFSGLSSINVLSPLDTSVHLLGVLPDKAKFFASATCPMFMEWKLKSNNDSTTMATSSSGEYKSNSTSNASSSSSSTTSPSLPPTTKIRQLSLASIQQQQLEETIHSAWKEPLTGALLFKTGTDKEPEDMRQDQLVVQLIDLCDRLFKKDGNLDLKLTPYKIVCLSRNCGLLEFIDHATHITDIKIKHNNVRGASIQNYLRSHDGNYDENGKYKLNPEILETFIRSSAGYCVITYILAVGDRHLENIMVKKTGHLLHIDFGFILGQNPLQKQILSTPMRLTEEMLQTMGGSGSSDYKRFEGFCCQAYRILRKNAKLICNLLELMSNADIADLSINQDSKIAIAKVRERLCMDTTDEGEAEQFLLARLSESAGNWKGKLLDISHNAATNFKYGGV